MKMYFFYLQYHWIDKVVLNLCFNKMLIKRSSNFCINVIRVVVLVANVLLVIFFNEKYFKKSLKRDSD